MKRRTLLLSGAAAGGALLVGYAALPVHSRVGARELLAGEQGAVALNGWIAVEPDGRVRLAMNRSEMGQGVHTALPMLVAEELDLPLEHVRLTDAGAAALYGNVAMFVGSLPIHPRDRVPGAEPVLVRAAQWSVATLARELGISVTGGSSSVADAWLPLRLAAATARAQLVGAASLRWRLPKEELVVREGVVMHASGPRAHFGELAAQAAATPAGEVLLKDRAAWTLIGQPSPRTDIQAKCNGSAVFGLDARPGNPDQLLFAAARMTPVLGGAPRRIVNEDDVLRRPGVVRMVRLPPVAGSTAGVAIVARSTWHARQALQALQIEWDAPVVRPDSAAIVDALEARARLAMLHDEGFVFHDRGDALGAEAKALAGGGRLFEQVYRAPYLAHQTLEPMNCTARIKDGRLALWAPTQAPTSARRIAARVAGLAEDAVDLHVTFLGGGFGRRLDVDVIAQAVACAQETGGRPVQLSWSREEDTTHDFYRPAGAAVLRAALDAQGKPQSLRIASTGDAITPRWLERNLPSLAGPFDLPDKSAAEGLIDQPYGMPHQRMSHVATTSGVPIGYWRSVGHSLHAFFIEGFIDELAAEHRRDPVAFRLSLLQDNPRAATVLRLAADRAGWGEPLPVGANGPRARGVALHESFGSVVAQVVEASVEDGRPRVHRIVCAIDCGTVVNPNIVAQQMEGGALFGLTAALHGRIDIEAGQVRQQSFPDQPLLGLADAPLVETHIVPSTESVGGVGEPGVPPVAPALANALFVLTGRRLRELPLRL